MSFRANANYLENEKTGNQGLYGWQKKKNRKSGDTANLRGYTVGCWPSSATSSVSPSLLKPDGVVVRQMRFHWGISPRSSGGKKTCSVGGRAPRSAPCQMMADWWSFSCCLS